MSTSDRPAGSNRKLTSGQPQEYRTENAGAELPLNADELSRLASQIYAQLSGVRVEPSSATVAAPSQPSDGTTSAGTSAVTTRPPIQTPDVVVPQRTAAPAVASTMAGPTTPGGSSPSIPSSVVAGAETTTDLASKAAAGPGSTPIGPFTGAALYPPSGDDSAGATSARSFSTGASGAGVTPAGIPPDSATPVAPAVPDLSRVLSHHDVPSHRVANPYSAGHPVPPEPASSSVADTHSPDSRAVPPQAPPIPGVQADFEGLAAAAGLQQLGHGGFTSPTTTDSSSQDLEPGPRTASQDYYFLGGPQRSGGIDHPVNDRPSDVFDVERYRADFPILAERIKGHPLIWFDNAATTQKPQALLDRISSFYAHENSNIHRGAHELAARATDAYEDARETVRRFIGAGRTEEVVFVRGATEAINLVAQSWGGKNLQPGDEILISHLEHHANIVPWLAIAKQTGAVLKVVPVDASGALLLDEFTALLGPRTKIVSITHVSNALGTVTPVQTITELAHRAGARVLIDAAQSVPHIPLDLQRLGADFLVFSGHKVFGPTGIGALYISERVWDETPAWQAGGNMIADVTLERAIYQGAPNKYEAGTGNIADAVGLAAALRYVEGVGIDRIAAYEHELVERLSAGLGQIAGLHLIGTAPEKASVASFVLDGYDPIEVGEAVNERGIAVRAGHHCAQPILRRFGVETTVRPSVAFYNTFDEVDFFVETIQYLADARRTRR